MSDHKPTCMTVEYAEADKALQAEWYRAHNIYMRYWPKHCADCGGWGLHYGTHDPSPAGVSLSAGTMTDVALCASCTEKGLCPRCGSQNADTEDEEHFTCDECGFAEGSSKGLPDTPQLSECDCWGFEDVQ